MTPARTDGFLVRRAVESDFRAHKALRLLALEHDPAAFADDLATASKRTEAEWTAAFSQNLSGDEQTLFVAEVEGLLIGMLGARRGRGPKLRHSADLFAMFIRPDQRGRGLGSALIAAVIAWGRELGLARLELSVTAGQTAAEHAYRSAGFTLFGTAHGALRVDGQDLDQTLMEFSFPA